MISRDMIENLFARTRSLRAEGRVSWDVDATCRWSFFFVDSDREKLLSAAQYLEARGYEFMGTLDPTPDDDDQETIYLRVDRIEKHTVDTLLSRNEELYEIARRFDLVDYDGMDCGAIEGP